MIIFIGGRIRKVEMAIKLIKTPITEGASKSPSTIGSNIIPQPPCSVGRIIDFRRGRDLGDWFAGKMVSLFYWMRDMWVDGRPVAKSVVIEATETLLEGRISTLISKSSILFLNLKIYPLSNVNYKALFCPSLGYGKRRHWLKRDLNSALMKG